MGKGSSVHITVRQAGELARTHLEENDNDPDSEGMLECIHKVRSIYPNNFVGVYMDTVNRRKKFLNQIKEYRERKAQFEKDTTEDKK